MKATKAYEGARRKSKRYQCDVKRGMYLCARSYRGINLVMHGYGAEVHRAGDEIIISALEHHANLVPWQMLCEEKMQSCA